MTTDDVVIRWILFFFVFFCSSYSSSWARQKRNFDWVVMSFHKLYLRYKFLQLRQKLLLRQTVHRWILHYLQETWSGITVLFALCKPIYGQSHRLGCSFFSVCRKSHQVAEALDWPREPPPPPKVLPRPEAERGTFMWNRKKEKAIFFSLLEKIPLQKLWGCRVIKFKESLCT